VGRVTGKTGGNPGSPGAGVSCRQDAISKSAFSGSTQNEVRGVKKYFDHERHRVQSLPEASRQTSGGRGSCRAVKPREGEAPAEPTTPWEGEAPAEPSTPREGEAPAEPDVSAQYSVFSNRKVPRWEAEAPAEPWESAA
jgi:hypothetical protein